MFIVTTDRISAFDVIMANGIPGKGVILNQMSAFWFDMFKSECENHVISVDDSEVSELLHSYGGSEAEMYKEALAGRSLIAKKAKPLKIECVARGYLAGSLYKEYVSGGSHIHGLSLPEGLIDSSLLPEPIFTPATKAEEGHDENISEKKAIDLVGNEVFDQVRDWTLTIYQRASAYAATKGIILADTKFEFGETEDGIIWIDEALTPDSSRFWPADQYQAGRQQPSYDKQFVRDFLEEIQFNKLPPGPELPESIVKQTYSKYVEAYELLTS